jgi:lysozyme
VADIHPGWFTGIIDLSHHHKQDIDWNAAKQAGIVAVIHKATEGLDVPDFCYHKRRIEARQAGLFWGSFHFSGASSSNGAQQADYYIKYADPQQDDFICFDCEKHGTFENMKAFVDRVRDRLGRYPAIYGRRLLRELMQGKSQSTVCRGILWYDEYPKGQFSTPQQVLPEGWSDWTIWQYTDGHSGPHPRTTPGVGNVDRSAFKGSVDEFKKHWPFSVA